MTDFLSLSADQQLDMLGFTQMCSIAQDDGIISVFQGSGISSHGYVLIMTKPQPNDFAIDDFSIPRYYLLQQGHYVTIPESDWYIAPIVVRGFLGFDLSWCDNGTWELESLFAQIPPEVLEKICTDTGLQLTPN